jgi:hypothetical protein
MRLLSSSESESKGWSTRWKTKFPSKVRVFLWRFAQHSLPTSNLLEHRHMSTTSTCTLCSMPDSWKHSLLECNMAASVWALADNLLVEHIYYVTQPNAKSWLFNLMETLPYIQFTRVAITLWAIWTSRRKAIHEEIFQSPLSTYSFVNLYLAELQAIATPAPTAQVPAPRPSGHARWIPPPKAIPKINVDAAVSKTEMRGVASTFC